MATRVMQLLGCVLLGLSFAACRGCVTVNRYPAEEGTRTQTVVGGEHGVVVNHGGGEGTTTTVGGRKGVVVEHQEDTKTDVQIGGPKGVTVEHPE